MYSDRHVRKLAQSMNGPVAIITASGRGIGAACARALRDRGCAVSLMSRTDGAIRLANELGGVGLQGSVSVQADLQRLVEATMSAYGRVDVVVNNTGDPPRGDLLHLDDHQWQDALNFILLNVVRMARLVTPIMLAQGGGAFVNISAADAYEPDAKFPIGSTYRAALGVWSKLYADRYAAQGIRMNCVLPGIVMEREGPVRPDIEASVPMKRPATYGEIANVVAFLLSSDASYLTGENIRVDGGLTRHV